MDERIQRIERLKVFRIEIVGPDGQTELPFDRKHEFDTVERRKTCLSEIFRDPIGAGSRIVGEQIADKQFQAIAVGEGELIQHVQRPQLKNSHWTAKNLLSGELHTLNII